MATAPKTATKQTENTAPPPEQRVQQQNAVAVLAPARLPYTGKNILDQFAVKPGDWKVLVEATFPSAKTSEAIVMALAYCRARNLDIFKRPIHIVPMWDRKAGRDGRGGYVETVWPGISELRTTAARTGNYAGIDEAEFGPIVERTFTGKVKDYKTEQMVNKSVTMSFPEWCRVTVYRMMPNGERCRFVGPKVKWIESYATISGTELPNEMWQDRAEGQVEKCAEAAALRRAFPEELGNDYIAEEMIGRRITDDVQAPRGGNQTAEDEPPSPDSLKSAAQPAQTPVPDDVVGVVDAEFEEVEGGPADDEPPPPEQAKQPTQQPKQAAKATEGGELTSDERNWLNDVAGAFSGCEDYVSFGIKQAEVMKPGKVKYSKLAWREAERLSEETFSRIQAAAN